MVRRRGGTPGGYDPGDGGGSDDVGADDSDPGDAPSATGGGGGGFDDSDPRDAPSARGGGGGFDGGSDDDDPGFDASDPRDAPSARGRPDRDPTPSGGETTVLDDLGQAYTETVAEPVGDFTAATNPVAQAEQATLGTDRIASVSEGFGEGVAQIGNIPGNTAGAIDAAQTLDRARSRAVDPVTVGGVPTGVTVPDLEGQQRNTEAAAVAAAGAAGAAAQSPFETTGRLAGGAVGGAAASRGIARVASRSSSGSSSGAVPSGRSQVGTEGVGSVLDPDDIGTTNLRNTGIDADDAATSGRTPTSTDSDGLPLQEEITDAGGVRRLLDEQRAGVRDFLGDDRAQAQLGRQRSPDTATVDRTRPGDAGGSIEDVRDDALTQIQDDLGGRARRPNPGTFDDAPQPFRDRGGDTIDADAGVQLQRSTATPDLDVGGVDEAAGFGAAGTASASGLGVLSSANDPTNIAGTEAVTGAQSRAGSRGGTGAGSFGTLGVLSAVNDPSQVAPTDDSDTGTDVGTDIGTDTTADVGADTLADTGSTGLGDGDTRTEPIPQLRGSTTVGTQQAPGNITDTAAGTRTVAEPDVAADIGADAFTAGRGGGFGGGTTTARGPRGEAEQDEDEEPPLFGLSADADRIDSGIASGETLLDDVARGLGLRSL